MLLFLVLPSLPNKAGTGKWRSGWFRLPQLPMPGTRTVRCRQSVRAQESSSLALRQGAPASDGHTCVEEPASQVWA